jgi:hypothetical protein
MFARLLVGLVLVVACGGDKTNAAGSNAPVTSSTTQDSSAPVPSATAATSEQSDDELVERAIRSIATISDLATRHGKNCDALAAGLAAHAKRDALTIAVFKRTYNDPAKQQTLAAKFGERIKQVGKAAATSIREHCADHAALKKVLAQLE